MKRIASSLAARLAWFRRTEDGSAAVIEMLMALALINMLLMSFFGWWEAYRAQATLERTAYTVSDLIARQRSAALSRTFLDGIERTAEYLVDDSMDVSIRVTQVTRTSGAPTLADGTINTSGLVVNWSYSPCNKLPSPVGNLQFLRDLPMLSVGPPILVVEVSAPYTSRVVEWAMDNSGFNVGLEEDSITFSRKVLFMPRFATTFGALTGAGTAACIT